MVAATTEPVRLPPGPRTPKLIQTVQFLVSNHAMFDATETSKTLDYQFVPIAQRLAETVDWMRRTLLS